MNGALIEELKNQYQKLSLWSYQLHSDNLKALIMEQPWLRNIPSYSTVLRRTQEYGWIKKHNSPRRKTPGQAKAAERLDNREVRGFESPYVHALWHLDFHSGRRVVDVHGDWHPPKALCILDDRSSLCCHIQWYLDETAETLIHGLTQAFFNEVFPAA